ncbi:HD domain-containing protein [Mesonia sp. HuA40]|uniref:HD domain-containing protein n=1 Tax=Mesonia sp. HuA40 TaxID=2602761 RepID=UPI0011C7A151|nr:HD domain-containing protein [Mesonia sp. HuA40]TXK72706.1 HD domain-containing protein [Mesonia sp. HuA40]
MQKNKFVAQTITFVKDELAGAEAGHDYFHIERVYKIALQIAQIEGANQEVVALAALLHDIADYKFHEGNESLGAQKAGEFLASIDTPEPTYNAVIDILKQIGFKGGHQQISQPSLELQVVQDADFLDAMGAIGIARTFNYGGFKNNLIYDPNISPNLNMSKDVYKKGGGTTINHFYEKLLRLKDKIQTSTGKKMAQKRHQFMQQYLSQFFLEWEGKV